MGDFMVRLLDRMLSTVVFRVNDEEYANKSIFQFMSTQHGYETTVLGIINGILPLLPGHPVLVKKTDLNTGAVVGFGICKKWW